MEHQISIGDFKIHKMVVEVTPRGSGFGIPTRRVELKAKLYTTDKYDSSRTDFWVSRSWEVISEGLTKKHLHQKVKELILLTIEHEIDEWLTIDGVLAEDPHPPKLSQEFITSL